MSDELRDLLAKAARLANAGEELSISFARELARVWRDAERALAVLVAEAAPGSVSAAVAATQAVVLKEQVRAILADAGYDRLIAAATNAGVERIIEAVFTGTEAAALAQFAGTSGHTVEALRRIAAMDLFAQGDETAHALWRSMVQHLFTARPVKDILQDLGDALDGSDAHVRNLFDTQMQIFTRQVEAIQTESLGDKQPFLYAGPIDDKTRDFCLERVGKVFTKADIDQMDNEQLPNTFLTGGGYNCRHVWLAVDSQELRGLTGTGQAAPPYSEDVAAIQARKAAKKAAKRKAA